MSALKPVGLLAATLVPLAVTAQVRIDERVDVTRVLVDVRVTDSRGQPARGLRAGDFEVRFDGTAARVEWAQWVGVDAPGEARTEAAGDASPSRRLIVFLFQKGVGVSREEGLLRMTREAARFADRLLPGDRTAVLVFDSRLRVWQDFTADRDLLRARLGRGVFVAPPAREPTRPSLHESLTAVGGDRAETPESALKAIGEALERFPGAKSLILFGYGFGDLHAPFGDPRMSRAQLSRSYDEARDTLVAARVVVFALDITNAGFHSLETSLMDVAEETGGFYSRTHDFPRTALDRLYGLLAGYYVLSVEKPPPAAAKRGRHSIGVKTSVGDAIVLARRHYVD